MLLRLENYSRNYGHRSVLSDINIAIDVGQIVCVMGPNGAGKTSFIEAILSYHRPNEARLFFKDNQILNHDSHQTFTSQCGYIGHEPGLMYDLTAIENLEYFADFHCETRPSHSSLMQLLS
ncbi:MAG: ATP-binding cassette domain-containing protein, partial [Leptonema sp. (in: Bacteria)]|nr:ATP-binding cassette domain-containing protein [Leptonema sp. (in: bacteria)]